MPQIPGFIDTMNKAIDTHKRKNDDYTGNNDAFFNFAFCDFVSSLFQNSRDKVYAVFIAVKLARLSVVLSKSALNESVEDSFDDLIVYAGIWKSDYMMRNKKVTSNPSDLATIRESK